MRELSSISHSAYQSDSKSEDHYISHRVSLLRITSLIFVYIFAHTGLLPKLRPVFTRMKSLGISEQKNIFIT